jgi:hypothetical protein
MGGGKKRPKVIAAALQVIPNLDDKDPSHGASPPSG